MQFGEISFCKNKGYNLKDDNHKKTILDELDKKFNFKIIQKHHEKFDIYSEVTKKRVNSVPHLVSTKTNGNPYLLYLTRHHHTNQCLFIDKKIQHGYFTPRMIMVKLWFKDSLFENTLFDGEMIKDKNDNWMFVINDIIAKENQPLSKLKLVERINILYETLKNSYYDDDSACCCISVKKYFRYEDIPYIIDVFIPKLNYTCRGLYFKPIYSNFKDLLLNFDESLIKNVTRTKFTDMNQKSFFSHRSEISANDSQQKEISQANIKSEEKQEKQEKEFGCCVFSVRKTKMPDVYEMQSISHELNTYNHDNSVIEIACVQNRNTSNTMRSIFNTLTFLEKRNMMCELHPKFKKWVPMYLIE